MPSIDICTWTVEYEISGSYCPASHDYPGHLPTVDILRVLNPLGETEQLDEEKIQEIKNKILDKCC